jgi:hypothetical protein
MVGQQMMMEARLRNRQGQQTNNARPRLRERNSRMTSISMMYSLMKPLMALGNSLRSKFRLPE